MSAREKKLAIAFGALLAAAALFFLFRTFAEGSAAGSSDPAVLLGQLQEMQSTIDSKNLWLEREIWLDANTPYHQSKVVASSVLLGKVETILKSCQMDIITQELMSEEDDAIEEDGAGLDHFQHVKFQIVAEGRMQDVVKCIHEIQTPENFTGIEGFNLEVAESGKYRASLVITHWFAIYQ
jgi:hypothetical protein